MAYVSEHAKRRGKERLGLPKRALMRLVPLVLKHGTTAAHYRGRMFRWLNGIKNDPIWQQKRADGGDVEPVVYGHHVFLFSRDQTLITVMNVPQALKGAVRIRRPIPTEETTP